MMSDSRLRIFDLPDTYRNVSHNSDRLRLSLQFLMQYFTERRTVNLEYFLPSSFLSWDLLGLILLLNSDEHNRTFLEEITKTLVLPLSTTPYSPPVLMLLLPNIDVQCITVK